MSSSQVTQRFGFGRLWLATVASNLGDGLVLAAFPLLASSLTDDPVAISIITVAAGLPWLVLGPVSGAVVDRFDRRLLIVVFDSGRALLLAVFALASLSGTVSLLSLYAVVFLIAAGETVVDTAAQSILPALVPKERLDRSNGRLFSAMTLANRFVGPPLGGALFAAAAVAPIAADSISFAVAALLVFSLAGKFRPAGAEAQQSGGFARSVKEGLVWLWRDRPIRTFAIGAALLNIGIMAGEAILVLFAKDQLSLGGVGFGALFAATAAGYTAGSASAPAITARIDRLRLVVGSVVATGISLGWIAISDGWVSASLGLFVIGLASGIWDVIAVSFRQARVPDHLLGRIMAAYRVLAHGSVPIGALVGGIAASIGGNRAAFAVGALLAAIAAFYVGLNLRGVMLDPAKAS